MSGEPLATVVITPRERFSTAPRALASVMQNTAAAYPLIYIVGSPPAYLQEFLTQTCRSPRCQLIIEPQLLFPNAARNIGLRHVETKYAVFLDNDVVVEPGWLDALIRCAEETQADVVGPLCLFGEPEKGIVHSAGGDLTFHEEGGRCWMVEKHRYTNFCLKTRSVDLHRAPCDFVEFHCMLTRRDLFDRIGLMDERIFSAGEHMDIALHVRARGGKTYTEPSAVVSYLTDAEYLVSDAEYFRLRWADDWNEPTLAHFAEKWKLDRHSSFFQDYESFLRRQQEICRLPRTVTPPLPAVRAARHPFAQTILQLVGQMQTTDYQSWEIETVREAYAAAAILFAGSYRDSGKTFIAHLVGTASVLAACGAPATMIVAGMLHAAYAEGRFQHHAEHDLAAQRRWLTGRIGWRAEALVFEYHVLDYSDAEHAVLDSDLDKLRMNLAQAIVIRIANSIDQHLDFGVLHTGDPQEILAKNTAQIERWQAVYRKVADRLAYGPMLDVLHTLHQEVKHTTRPSASTARPTGNYAIDPKTATVEWTAPRRPSRISNPAPFVGASSTLPSSVSAEPLLERLRRAQLGRLLKQINLEDIVPQNQGVLRLEGRSPEDLLATPKLVLETDPRQWSFSASVNVIPSEHAQGPAVLRVTLGVERGELGIGLLRKGSTTDYAQPEQNQDVCTEPIDLLIPIDDLREVGPLIFRSWAASGLVTVGSVFAVSLHLPGTR